MRIHELARLFFHAFLQRFLFAQALFGGVFTDVLRNSYRAEARDLRTSLRERFVVELAGGHPVEAEVELIFQAVFEAGRQRESGELIDKASRDSFNWRVPFEFNLNAASRPSPEEFLPLTGRQIPIELIHNPHARRYVLRLRPDGSARVTIPRGGCIAEARRFAERNAAWLERRLQRFSTLPTRPREWLIGTEIHFRGELVTIEAGVNGERGHILVGTEAIKVKDPAADLRRAIESHLWRLAAKELPPKVLEYAMVQQLTVRRVTVRNQRSRWGSCSRRGTISLNWRLIQTPPLVRDYLILHELMHLRQMNHSAMFWREVERVCPDYKVAERWLKQHSALLE